MRLVFTLLIPVFLWSCATTETLNVWKEEGTSSKYANVLVIGVVKDDAYRRMLENMLVIEFEKMNVKAYASHKLFPDVEKLDKNAVRAKVEESDYDSVVVSRMIDRKKEVVHQPATTYVSGSYYRGYPFATTYNRSNTWYGYYDNSYQVYHSPAYSVDYDITTAETNLYDAKTEGLVLSAMTETSETSKANAVRSFVKRIMKELKSSNLF